MGSTDRSLFTDMDGTVENAKSCTEIGINKKSVLYEQIFLSVALAWNSAPFGNLLLLSFIHFESYNVSYMILKIRTKKFGSLKSKIGV